MSAGRRFVAFLLALVLTTAPASSLWAAKGGPEPIVVKDPHYGEVLFHFYQEDYFPAIVRLLAAQEQEQLEEHADEAELLLGGLYLSYGHHLEAADIFERLLADTVSEFLQKNPSRFHEFTESSCHAVIKAPTTRRDER